MQTMTRRALALALVALFALAGCGEAPDDENGAADGGTTDTATDGATDEATEDGAEETPAAGGDDQAAGDFRGCLVTDAGGVDDRSFNQTAYAGLEQAESELGIEIAVLESQSEADYEPNIQSFVDQDCDIIVTVGFLLGDATEAAAQANSDQLFAIVDYGYEDDYENLLELNFATDQAAFLAGYVAAGASESGTVGTYGGINIPTVSAFMDGYLAGVRHYNEENGADVTVEGWDGSDGLFTGNFESQDDGRNVTDTLLQEGADIIMPVAGPVGLGSATAIEDFGEGLLVWVDTDGYESVPQYQSLMLTSVMKNMDVAVFEAVQSALEGSFEGGQYLGTLENDGVGIAPFHDNEDRVPSEVQDAVEEIRQGIIDGSISTASSDYEG